MEFGRFDLPRSKLVFLGRNLATLDSLENGRFALASGNCGLSQAVCHGVSHCSLATVGNHCSISSVKPHFVKIFLFFQWIARLRLGSTKCVRWESGAQM